MTVTPLTRRGVLAAPWLCPVIAHAAGALSGRFQWQASEPLISAENRDGDQYQAIKDPSLVRYEGRWHVFCTLRGKRRSHQIEYLSFRDWSDRLDMRRTTLRLTGGYFCAPQVFYFRPHGKWYLIYQIGDASRRPPLQPAYSITTSLADPSSWSAPTLLLSDASLAVKNWIDFWIVCDSQAAHLFFTTLNGKMWRMTAPLSRFPNGWGPARVVLEDDIFEASHTYRLKGRDQYLTLVEAQAPAGRRYYKAYVAASLVERWEPLAASPGAAFAEPRNVRFAGAPWTDSFSHGELVRDSVDESLTIDPSRLTFLFQGVSPEQRRGKNYGEIPWRLGLLRSLK